jgi:hypothetical protein
MCDGTLESCYIRDYQKLKCIECVSFWKNIQPVQQQQFNYECPDCHGKFNQPSYPAVTSSICYKCPFCGRLMEGLK